jgi:hypothetical protein
MKKEIIRFEGHKLARFMMYNGWLVGILILCSWFLFYPLALGRGFLFLKMIKISFFSSAKLTLWFLFLCLLSQILTYDLSCNKIKFLEILEDKAVFHLLNGKIHEFTYSDLSSLEFTDGLYELFLFTFKDGKKQKISSSVKNHKIALKAIQQKIIEANLSKTKPH